MILDEVSGIYYIVLKDLRAYYFKPPNISWGILFPLTMTIAFTLRNPSDLAELSPGLVAMAALFGTTSMEAIVITFEKRVGAMERLIMAPISLKSILMGKVLGGSIFGLMMAGTMTLISCGCLGMPLANLALFTAFALLTVLTLSSLGALIAVSVREVFEAQTLSNYFRFPMIFLCGVFLPVEALPTPLRAISYLLPLTYSVDALRQATIGPIVPQTIVVDAVILASHTLILFMLADKMLRKGME